MFAENQGNGLQADSDKNGYDITGYVKNVTVNNAGVFTLTLGDGTAVNLSAVVSGIKGDAETTFRTGQVNITAADIGIEGLAGGTATTQPVDDNSTKLATTAFVQNRVAQLVNSSPEALDTLKELSDALGGDPNFATTISTRIGTKLDATAEAVSAAKAKTDYVDQVIHSTYIKGLTLSGATFTLTKGNDTTSTFSLTKTDVTTALGYEPPTEDTHYTTKLVVGTLGGTANAEAINPYIKLYDNNTVRDTIRLEGTGTVTVNSDNAGNITINGVSEDTHYVSKLVLTSANGTANSVTTNTATYLRLFDDSIARNSIRIRGDNGITVEGNDGVLTISADTVSDASNTTAGITKLYTSTGNAVDGTMTQKAISDLFPILARYSLYKSAYRGDMLYGSNNKVAPCYHITTSGIFMQNYTSFEVNYPTSTMTEPFYYYLSGNLNGSTIELIDESGNNLDTHPIYSYTPDGMVAGLSGDRAASCIYECVYVPSANASYVIGTLDPLMMGTFRVFPNSSYSGAPVCTIDDRKPFKFMGEDAFVGIQLLLDTSNDTFNRVSESTTQIGIAIVPGGTTAPLPITFKEGYVDGYHLITLIKKNDEYRFIEL